MDLIIGDLGLPLLAFAMWLSLAVPVRVAGGRIVATFWATGAVYDWNLRRIRSAAAKLRRHGRTSRHGLPDVLVAAVEADLVTVAELDEIAPRPATEDVGITDTLTTAQRAEVVALTTTVGTVREDYTFTEPSRAARRAALQADTILIPLVKLEEVDARVRTRADFAASDDMAARHDMEFAAALGVFLHDNTLLLAELEVARMYRGWLSSATGENPMVGER